MNKWVNDAMQESLAIPYDDAQSAALLRRRQIIERMVEFKELLMMHACAIKEIRTKLEILNTEFNLRYHRNPIHSINTRLKSVASIASKMEKYGKPFTIEDIDENMHDIAGVRVICPYIDDIYTIADAILRQDDITYVEKKDYIRSPKPNGYRSLHLIVRVPVFFADRRKDMTVEIQIRTIAMDFWASLEHQLRYKEDADIDTEILDRLRECAITINETDREMLAIRCQLEKIEDKPSEEELLMERFAKIDMSLL
jgi:putative GTP pyrophosphokinase